MLLAGQKVKTSPAGKPASKFRPFFPWYYLSYQVAPHCVLPQPSKAFVIRSFFFEKWLLTHAFGGPKGQNFSCRQACVEVPAFFPLVLCKQRLDLLKYLAVCLDLILISDHAYRASLKDRLRDRCKGADVFHSRV